MADQNQLAAYEALLALLAAQQSLLVAFSGGVDSSLLARAAQAALPGRVRLVFGQSALSTPEEEEQARALAQRLALPYQALRLEPLALPEVANNRPDRCYACKRALYQQLWRQAEVWGLAALADGANADDLDAPNRPGNRAARELQVLQPLAAAGLRKADVRALARHLGLPNHAAPARPCLATRFPYDTPLDEAALARVATGERLLRTLGLREFRLRVHGDLCRIEAGAAERALVLEQAAEIRAKLRALGYGYVTLDLAALQSGSYDAMR